MRNMLQMLRDAVRRSDAYYRLWQSSKWDVALALLRLRWVQSWPTSIYDRQTRYILLRCQSVNLSRCKLRTNPSQSVAMHLSRVDAAAVAITVHFALLTVHHYILLSAHHRYNNSYLLRSHIGLAVASSVNCLCSNFSFLLKSATCSTNIDVYFCFAYIRS